MNLAEQTYVIFSVVLIVFIILPIGYWIVDSTTLNRVEKRNILFDWRFLIPCILYALLLGYRYDYAYDWMQYYNTFEYIQKGMLYRDDSEKGYLFINRLLGLLGFNYYSIFILEGFVYVYAIFFLFKDNRRFLVFVLPLVYIANRYACLNISRQFFAMSLLYIAFRNLLDGKKIVYWILALIACSIHLSTAVFVVPFYFIPKLGVIKRNVMVIMYLISLFFSNYFFDLFVYLISYFSNIVQKQYTADLLLLDKFQREPYSFLQIFVRSCKEVLYIVLFYRLYHFNKSIVSKKYFIYLLIGLYSILLTQLLGLHEILSRSNYYFNFFYEIGWGILLYFVFKEKSRMPWWIIVGAIFVISHYVYLFYANISSNITIRHFLEYRNVFYL